MNLTAGDAAVTAEPDSAARTLTTASQPEQAQVPIPREPRPTIPALVGPVNSRADSLQKVYEPAGEVVVGGTAHVTVRVRNLSVANNLYQAGFSVLFSIDPASTGSAVLLGGDGSYGAGTRFDVSGLSGAADGGHATIFMKITAPGTIIINARIPACGTTGIGKYVGDVVLSPGISITGVRP